MSLIIKISDELKAAMKAGEVVKRDTLRFFQSALKNAAIEARKPVAEFADVEVEAVAKKLVKQRKDSIAQYAAASRTDLVEKEQAELVFIEAYLPQAMPEAELRTLVEDVLKDAGIVEQSKMGQAMGAVMKKVAGRASGDDVRKMVASFLT